MKKVLITASILVLSAAAAAAGVAFADQNYTVSHQCNTDEVAAILDTRIDGDGLITVSATCLPAECT